MNMVRHRWRIACDISSNYPDIVNRADISDKWSPLAGSASHPLFRANNKITGRIILCFVLDLWDKNTVICAGTMQYRRDFRQLPG